ncbi:MAG: nucleotidyltransferase domain-containing protein [Candidatus Muiribacteriota bacterium]|jgi:predicted nucleotidyltransferase
MVEFLSSDFFAKAENSKFGIKFLKFICKTSTAFLDNNIKKSYNNIMNIKKLSQKNIDLLITNIKKELIEFLGLDLKEIILYGSYTNGNATPGSDIDIMILFNKKPNNNLNEFIIDLMVKYSLEYNILVSIVEANYNDFIDYSNYIPFYKNVREHGIKYYAA